MNSYYESDEGRESVDRRTNLADELMELAGGDFGMGQGAGFGELEDNVGLEFEYADNDNEWTN